MSEIYPISGTNWKDQHISSLKAEITSLKETLEIEQKESKTQFSQCSSLLNLAEREIETLEANKARLQAEKAELEEGVDSMKRIIGNFQELAQVIATERDALQARCAALEEDNLRLKVDVARITTTSETIEASLYEANIALGNERNSLRLKVIELEEKGDAMARCLEWYCEGTSKGADRGSIEAWNKAKGAK